MKMNFEALRSRLGPSVGQDALASVVVFLVALPLCMGVAIASGVPPALGLITGIVGGLVVGMLAGAPLQVSGPAAGLTVLIWEIVHQHGLGMLGTIVLAAGLLQLLAGALRLAPWFRAISPAVLQGMLAGIGLLIVGSQIHVMVDDKPRGSGLENLLSIPEALWKGLVPVAGSAHHVAAALGLATIAIMIAWPWAPRRLRAVPAPLVAVTAATLVAVIFQLPVQTVTLPDNLATAISWPSLETLMRLSDPAIASAALAIAVIASAETLLSTTAVDRMHRGPRARYNKELIAQGVGNSLCGLLGALPMTGVIVRSSVNVQAGAQTRLSAMLHGAWLLAFVALLPFVLTRIPTTALAAMLVFTGFKLVSHKAVKELWAFGKLEVAIYVVTVVAIIATNLLEGVLIGLALSLAKLFISFAHCRVTAVPQGEREVTLVLDGAATFVKLPQIAAVLEPIEPGVRVRVDVSHLDYIDHACLDLLKGWSQQHEAMGGSVEWDWHHLEAKYHRRRLSATAPLKSKQPLPS